MALLRFDNIGILGIAGAVPKKVINNYEYTEYFKKEDVKDVVDKIGVYERRFAPDSMCSSDLCYAAADKLLSDMNIDREEIDLLIFISQTPDYRMPSTSFLLQNRLGLSSSTMVFDISIGCSGFIYGLSVVYSLMQNSGFRKALLLNGETRSKVYSPKDRKTAFLFGDGGAATLISNDKKFPSSYFSLNSDGSRESLIKIDAGGYRNPSSEDTLKERVVDEYGNIRNQEQGYMNGADVFNFVLREIPKDIKKVLAYSSLEKCDIDYFVFHQANSFINNFLAKKLKLEKEKIPSSVEKYGNTSSVSIPLTIVSELKNNLEEEKRMLISGFGVGMSWASAVFNFKDCFISDIIEL